MIEIYGIPDNVYRCWGCHESRKLLDSLNIKYQFHEVIRSVDNELGFEYNRPKIEELANRLNVKSLRFVYPQIFIDDKHIGGYKQLKELYDE